MCGDILYIYIWPTNTWDRYVFTPHHVGGRGLEINPKWFDLSRA